LKKNILILMLVFISVLSGCRNIEMPLEAPVVEMNDSYEIKAEDLFPFTENTIYVYEGYGNEYASQEVFFEYIDSNLAQIKVINSGTNSVRILQKTIDGIKEVYFEGEFYHIEDMRYSKPIKDVMTIKNPIEVGNSWIVDDKYTREITGIDVELDTPYGKFNAVEITTTLENDTKLISYYKEGIGQVGSIFSSPDGDIKTLLKEIISGPIEREIRLFYPTDSTTMKTVWTNHTLKFNTNDRLEDIFNQVFTNPVKDGLIPLISEETIINSINFDRSTWRVTIDFSDELIPGWNAGSTFELQLIKSIVNTLGSFFDTDKVYISIEGKPFESGHLQIKEGEEFIVDYSDIDEF